MYRKIEDTTFGAGYINDEYIVALPNEFDYQNNILATTFNLSTYYDDMTGLYLYGYKDTLVTFKELRREYLADYCKVR